MKNLVLRYGIYAALFLVGIQLIFFFTMDQENPENYKMGEIIGYSTILLSMVFVFLGIKKHRDENNGGTITFWEALKVGVLIVAIPSIAFGLYNWFYVEVLDPEFMDTYFQYSLEQAEATMSPEEFEAMKATMDSQKEMFQNLGFQFILMFLTVFIIGFVVSVISSIVLKKDKTNVENSMD